MPEILKTTAERIEIALALVGAVLLWRLELSPAARARRTLSPLPPWNASIVDFLRFGFSIIGGAFVAGLFAGVTVSLLGLRGDAVTIFNGSAAQFGLLAGVAIYQTKVERVPLRRPVLGRAVFMGGAATFLAALPLLHVTAIAWQFFLQQCGLPVDHQDLIGMFAHADSPWLLTILILLAVVIAPLTEELVFRAGLFRYFRTRMPHWVALMVPALLFASLHVNWQTLQGLASLAPLVVLAIAFSIAYERTGHIGTAVVAHALFNLNTVFMIFGGVGLDG
jgi:membrane protease YdiL (CAAX protease family)